MKDNFNTIQEFNQICLINREGYGFRPDQAHWDSMEAKLALGHHILGFKICKRQQAQLN